MYEFKTEQKRASKSKQPKICITVILEKKELGRHTFEYTIAKNFTKTVIYIRAKI